MWVDLLGLFAVAFFTAAGYFRGFVSTIFAFVAALAAYGGAGRLARWVEKHSDWSTFDPESRYWIMLLAAAGMIYLSINLIGLLASHFVVGKKEDHRKLDSLMGLVLGVIQGTMIGLFFACLMGAVPGALQESSPWLARQSAESRLVAAVAPYNPIRAKQKQVAWLKRLAELAALASKAQAMEKERVPESARRFLSEEGLQGVFEDNSLAQALRDADYAKILTQKHWRRMLFDEKFREKLEAVDLARLREDLERAAEPAAPPIPALPGKNISP